MIHKMLNNHRLVTVSEAPILIDDGCRDRAELVVKEGRKLHSSLAPHHQQPSKQLTTRSHMIFPLTFTPFVLNFIVTTLFEMGA